MLCLLDITLCLKSPADAACLSVSRSHACGVGTHSWHCGTAIHCVEVWTRAQHTDEGLTLHEEAPAAQHGSRALPQDWTVAAGHAHRCWLQQPPHCHASRQCAGGAWTRPPPLGPVAWNRRRQTSTPTLSHAHRSHHSQDARQTQAQGQVHAETHPIAGLLF